MTILIITLLVLVTSAVLVYPFWVSRHGGRRFDDPAADMAASIRRARDRVYEEIRVLQQEYFLHNLTEDEYREQLQVARQRAAELIREQQQVEETIESIEHQASEELGLLPPPNEDEDDDEELTA